MDSLVMELIHGPIIATNYHFLRASKPSVCTVYHRFPGGVPQHCYCWRSGNGVSPVERGIDQWTNEKRLFTCIWFVQEKRQDLAVTTAMVLPRVMPISNRKIIFLLYVCASFTTSSFSSKLASAVTFPWSRQQSHITAAAGDTEVLGRKAPAARFSYPQLLEMQPVSAALLPWYITYGLR